MVTSAKQRRDNILVLGTQRTQQITGRTLRISFHPDWQIDNGFFNRPVMTRTQILKHTDDPEQGFQRCFADGLNQSLVSFALKFVLNFFSS